MIKKIKIRDLTVFQQKNFCDRRREGRSLPGGKEVTDFKPNLDGSYLFASMGRGKEQTTCFIDSRTGAISFEGSPKHREELFEKAKKFLKERKEEKL